MDRALTLVEWLLQNRSVWSGWPACLIFDPDDERDVRRLAHIRPHVARFVPLFLDDASAFGCIGSAVFEARRTLRRQYSKRIRQAFAAFPD